MKLASSFAALSVPLRTCVQALFTAAVVAAVAALEVFGRLATSDVQDSIAVLGLMAVVGGVVAWHRRRPLPWVNWLVIRGADAVLRLKKLKYDHGFDFRGDPPLPRKLPPAVWWLAAALAAWAGVAVAVWLLLPNGWRDIGLHTSYVLYLLALAAVWTLLLAGLMAGLFLPLLLLDRHLRETTADADRRKVMFLSLLGYLFVLSASASLLPAAAAVGVCLIGAGVAVYRASLTDPPGLAVLWRSGADSGVQAVPVPRVVAVSAALGIGVFVVLVLTGGGGRLWSHLDPADAMPLTASLAAGVAWTGPGLLVLFGLRVLAARRTDPGGDTPPTAFVRNTLSAAALQAATSTLKGWGWRVRTDATKLDADDVRIELVHPERSEATEFDPAWPLKVTPADLGDPDVRHRLHRRDEIRMRRHVFRGLNALIKKGIAAREDKGGGFWFAPHWWFILGLGREDGPRGKKGDAKDGAVRRIGPPFRVAFGVRPRQHLHRMLRAVQVDIIYIEDGVPLRTLAKVLRTMFEVYDVHAGQKVVDDHTFQGIPKVKVMVHEFSPDKPPPAQSGPYRQPKYDDLSRGRVMHIFRDRGGHEEPIEPPFDFSSAPAPAMSA